MTKPGRGHRASGWQCFFFDMRKTSGYATGGNQRVQRSDAQNQVEKHGGHCRVNKGADDCNHPAAFFQKTSGHSRWLYCVCCIRFYAFCSMRRDTAPNTSKVKNNRATLRGTHRRTNRSCRSCTVQGRLPFLMDAGTVLLFFIADREGWWK